MTKFRKKPVVIEAMQWMGYMTLELREFLTNCDFTVEGPTLYIETLEGRMATTLLDYVICGIKGEFYPCAEDIFELTYERVE